MSEMLGVAAKDRVAREYLEEFRKCAGDGQAGQGGRLPGGWGIAGYLGNWAVHFGRSAEHAAADRAGFDEAAARSALSSSKIVIAHLRQDHGDGAAAADSAPFIHYDWVFCHGGKVSGAEKLTIPRYRYEGTTGSERFFKYLIDRLYRRSVRDFPTLVREAAAGARRECPAGSLSFLLSNREYLLGYRDLSGEGERRPLRYAVTPHSFVFCSRKLPGFDWIEMKNGELIIVNKRGGFLDAV